MARTVRMNLEQAKAQRSSTDWALVHAQTSEADIRRQMIEDGEKPDADHAWRVVPSAAGARRKLGLTQPQFAALIRVPVATVRNWEQGRVVPDAAARALLAVLWYEPEASVRALQVA